MAEQSVIVWDLGTVPDLDAAAQLHGLDTTDQEVVRIQSLFQAHCAHPNERLAEPALKVPADNEKKPN